MGKVFERETDRLKQQLLKIAEMAETQVRNAIQSMITRDRALADEVVEMDRKVDNAEVALEEECLKLLALHQPVANDLRLIIAALKINNDLERIGDLASFISKVSRDLTAKEPVEIPPLIEEMGKRTKLMFKKSLLAFLELDVNLAREALSADDEVDAYYRRIREWVIAELPNRPTHVDQLLSILSVGKALERIGDQASNIAEDVVYLLEGDIIRHGRSRGPRAVNQTE